MLSGQGVLLSVAASLIFAVLGWYSTLLVPLHGLEIVAWRIVWTVPGMLVVLGLLRHQRKFTATLGRLRHEPLLWLVLPVNGFLLGVQQWLFMWAPLEGRLLEVTLGYFLLPLVMVMVGFLFYRERPGRLQWVAVTLACIGVLHELVVTQAFSWVTLVTALGYPPYLMLRRAVHLDPVSGFLLETLVILPFAALAIYLTPAATGALSARPVLWLLLPFLGVMTAAAFAAYLGASKLLPISMLGILGYVEPVLLFVISLLFLGEPFTAAGLGTYGPIWLAVLLTCGHSAIVLRRQQRTARQAAA